LFHGSGSGFSALRSSRKTGFFGSTCLATFEGRVHVLVCGSEFRLSTGRRDLPASQNFLILSQHVYLFVYNNMGYMNIFFANFFPLKYQCEICLFQNFKI
jgi:hypothetical protein